MSVLQSVENLPREALGAKKATSVADTFQRVSQREHVLLRPDTYIGSIEPTTTTTWVFDEDVGLNYRQVTFVPGLYKIFDEILVNAADNKQRDENMDTLKVELSPETGTISVFNNGKGLPVEIHPKEGIYVPELVFGHLLTSSNYNDNEKKVTGGRNGFGAKLANIFSHEFVVETYDGKKKYRQTFNDNMTKRGKPVIKDMKKPADSSKDQYTKISFKPDLPKFAMDALDADTVALLMKRVHDIAEPGCNASRGLKVYVNGKKIAVKNFQHYCQMYIESAATEDRKLPCVYERVNDRWEVCLSLSDGQQQQVSFVNSICTIRGGTHVANVADNIASKIMDGLLKKHKGMKLKPYQVKNHLWIFVNSLIENPAFDSQTKETLTTKPSSYGSKCDISPDFHKKVAKSGILESILEWAKVKQSADLKKTDGSKKQRITGIPKLEDANNAGTRYAEKCTLILTEGDSAKALAVSGLSVVGRDNYGVFPLRGKLLNVREANHKQLMENAEVAAIKKIMGLQNQKSYNAETIKSLRYGHIMIMADQDHDGSHIKGLIINMIHYFWPSLLKVPGFLTEFVTPIVKVTKGKQSHCFFTVPEYKKWAEQTNTKGWTIKYYKGLGTSTSQEAKEYFSHIQRHQLDFAYETDPDSGSLIDMAFNKKKANERKKWLEEFEKEGFVDHSKSHLSFSDFINKELIHFSNADNIRSIPSMVDGLKPGQRKIIFSCFKRKLKKEIKVAQLAGYVSEHSAYHHGEQALAQTIVNLAQDFPGSNNINYLYPGGQFGTRAQGGKDHASPRYIFTRLSTITRKIFHEDDDAVLSYLTEDGQTIEPEWYVPIIPTVLINGGDGIGTGWSTSIPNYNPRDVIENLKRLVDHQEAVAMFPWYKGYKGTIKPSGQDGQFISYGLIKRLNDTTLQITELPIRQWTQPYKEFLESLMPSNENKNPAIKEYREYHTDTTVNFIISMTEKNMKDAEEAGFYKIFKLSSTINTTNMNLFDKEGHIRKYNSPEEILQDFLDLRLNFYQKRKDFLADKMRRELKRLSNKVRFIRAVISGNLKVNNRKKNDIVKNLEELDFDKLPKTDNNGNNAVEEEEVEIDHSPERLESNASYDYLLSMPLWSLTKERVDDLINEEEVKKSALAELLATTTRDLYLKDLDALSQAMDEEDERAAKENNETRSTKGAKGGRARKPDGDDSDDEYNPSKKPQTKGKKKKANEPEFDMADAEDISLPSTPIAKAKTRRPKKEIPMVSADNEIQADTVFQTQGEYGSLAERLIGKLGTNPGSMMDASIAKAKAPAKRAPKKKTVKLEESEEPEESEESDGGVGVLVEECRNEVDAGEKVDEDSKPKPTRKPRKPQKQILSSDEESDGESENDLSEDDYVPTPKKAPAKKAAPTKTAHRATVQKKTAKSGKRTISIEPVDENDAFARITPSITTAITTAKRGRDTSEDDAIEISPARRPPPSKKTKAPAKKTVATKSEVGTKKTSKKENSAAAAKQVRDVEASEDDDDYVGSSTLAARLAARTKRAAAKTVKYNEDSGSASESDFVDDGDDSDFVPE